jgi:voltage-gated potassium channel
MDWRAHVRTALDGNHPGVGRGIKFCIFGLIVFSTLAIGVETLPDLPHWMRVGLAVAEVVVVAVFTVEYALRIAVAPDRLAYVRSFWGIIDLVAILPFYLGLLFAGFGVDLRAVRALRLLRLFRLLKMARYSIAMDRLAAAFRMVREELVVFGVAALVTLYLAAIGIYYFENEAQPEAFSSVFASMWWAAVTLTTVGYGDIYPVTTGGRIFTVVMLLVALGVIAVPTGLVSSALSRVRQLEPPPPISGDEEPASPTRPEQ